MYNPRMVDINLPKYTLRWMFLDLNSYFAAVEQQVHPELRGRPVVVAPVSSDTTCAIAASYEAKAYGIRTGTNVGEARRLCPGLEVVEATPNAYTHYHERVKEAVEQVLPIERVCSIDEMRMRLLGEERVPERAVALAKEIKAAIREHAGECLTASVGVAGSPFLAKIGTELQKPDGLVTIEAHDLPERLHCLKLTDFPGINRRMKVRLNAAGIFDSRQLCAASKERLALAFRSRMIGERWWHLLRGEELLWDHEKGKSLGHSHVMAPELRTERGCREVMLRLLQKATARLRAEGYWAGEMVVSVRGKVRSWSASVTLPPTQDTMTFNEQFDRLWEEREFVHPHQASVTFYHLRKAEHVTPSLFDGAVERGKLMAAIDEVNRAFGKNKVYLAGMHRAKDAAPERIAFDKTWLFVEGKGDHEWIEPAGS